MPLLRAAFPHALLPLHIFEPRYREMLKHASPFTHVLRCIAQTALRGMEFDRRLFQIATVGLIRACVERNDGTSNLILQDWSVSDLALSGRKRHSDCNDESLESTPHVCGNRSARCESTGTYSNLKEMDRGSFPLR